MKQSICNKIISIYNFSIMAIYIFSNIIRLSSNFGFNYSNSSSPFGNDITVVQNFIIINFIIAIIINLYFFIINSKNGKMIFWFITPIAFYLSCIWLAKSSYDFWMYTSSYTSEDLFNDLWAVIPAIILLFGLILEIKAKHPKRRIKIIVLQILGIILCILTLVFKTYNTIVWFNNALIWLTISSIMLFIRSSKTEEKNKATRVISPILLSIATILLIIFGVKVISLSSKIANVNAESNNFINTIKNNLQAESKNNDINLIYVRKNGKYGYIDTKGKEVIPCEYDHLSTLDASFVIGQKGNNYYYITKNGKIITERANTPVPWISEDSVQTYLLSTIPRDITSNLGIQAKTDKNNKETTISCDKADYVENDDSYRDILTYKMSDGYTLICEENEKSSDDSTTFKLIVKENGKIIDTFNKAELEIDYLDYKLTTYENGDVPFYNLEEQIQGYYSNKNHKFNTLKGAYEILDVFDDYVLINDWSNPSKTQNILINQDNKNTLKAPKICHIQDGFIIQKNNNKFVFLDNNLKAVTAEFDFIDMTYASDNILICINEYEEYTNDCTIINTKGNPITTTKYDLVNKELYSLLLDFEYDFNNCSIDSMHDSYHYHYAQ